MGALPITRHATTANEKGPQRLLRPLTVSSEGFGQPTSSRPEKK